MKGIAVKNARLLLILSLLLIASCGDDDQAELTALTGPESDPLRSSRVQYATPRARYSAT